MAILMGRWDCDACNRKGNLGDSYSCEGCGAGRPEDVEFYLTSDAEVITDAEGIRAAEAGADWQCEYCDEWVPATKTTCPDCTGGSAGGSKRHEDAGKVVTSTDKREVTDIHDEYAGNVEEPVSEFIGDNDHDKVLKGHSEDPPPKRSSPPSSIPRRSARRNQGRPMAMVGIGLAVLAFTALMWAIFHTTEVPATVSHHSWERVQKVEEFTRGIKKDGWSHPSDAYDISSSRKIHHYRKVFDHTERQSYTEQERYQSGTEPVYSTRTVNLGNGRFRTERYQSGTRPTYSYRTVTKYRNVDVYRDEPVYDTYYHYKVDRWVESTPRVKSGLGLSPEWPSTKCRDEDQRMGSRHARYLVHFVEANPPNGEEARTWTKECNETVWRSYNDGDRFILVVNMTGIQEIKPVKVESE